MNCDKLPKVSIIILNWNGWEDTIECLESIYHSNYSNYNVIVIDNHSDNDSIQKIKDYSKGKIKVKSDFFVYDSKNKPIEFHEYTDNDVKNLDSERISKIDLDIRKLTIIKNNKNYGFSKGSNIGIDYAIKILNPNYIFLLNNDTVIDKDSLFNLVNVGESDEKIGVIGSKEYYYYPTKKQNRIHSAGGKINFIKYPGYYPINYELKDEKKDMENIYECDWITGAAMMLKIKNTPLFLNTEFFFGCEDIDLCIRQKKAGFRIVVSPKSKIWHKMGISRKKKYHNLEKGFFQVINGRTRNIKTNLQFLKMHNDKYYQTLPLYIPTLIKQYLYDIFLKLKYEIKR